MVFLDSFLGPVALSALFSSAQASTHIRSVAAGHLHRRQSIPTDLPANWTSLGCFTDTQGTRTLSLSSFTSGDNMTVPNCIDFCGDGGFIYAGVEYSQECYCGNNIEAEDTNATATDCNMACTGNTLQLCGGPNRMNVFWSGATPPAPPAIVPSVGDWTSLGCYSDNVDGQRTFTVGLDVADVTIEKCTSACFTSGYQFAGTEYSTQCFCGSSIANGGALTASSDCTMTCAGNSSQFCGGPNRLNAYNYTGTNLPPINNAGGGGGGGPTTVFPVLSDLPQGWSYNACWVDNAHGRIFETEIGVNTNQTVQSCIASCIAQNFTVAGMEFGQECYCGDRLVNGATVGAASDCSMSCTGNATEACGAGNRLSVYSTSENITALPVPVPLISPLPGNWVYNGCYTDEQVGTRTLPWQNIWPTNNTVEACLNQCAAFGYSAAGLEYGQECYCGDITDIAAHGSVHTEDSDCATQCPGDPLHLCGGGLRLQLYTWNGTLNVWHTPEVTGRYEFFVPGVVVPLIATVGINNKVTFLEKDGTGFPNSTGAYELDLSLVDNFDLAWREMHVKTDVFCSGSIILPDIGGRQINVGGWSLESTFGIRIYTPNGVPGTNSTNDWEENWQELSLQRGRWYPTAMMMANGTILVIGGETGSNASPQPNLELLPKPDGGDTVVDLPWLQRTDPNNLYPFMFVLPGGGILSVYYNEARILDATTFDTVKELPNVPASVDDFLGGRTYPLEGSAVLFPQHAPYTDPLRVLVCGGSSPGAGIALDNCVSIEPEVDNSTWTLERMPSQRVMSCMVPLPDGTFLILNGAHQGVAGFGLATDPNLGAVLYDPTLPVNQRMSILNTTIVARMYHSEAILLPDARVLVSGSDPQDGVNPEEFRIEVYIPPYLDMGFTQPTYTLEETDWSYGGTYTVSNITLHQGQISGVRVSLVGAVSSTHGNSMGSRTIFPAISCSGTSCTVTAPPNANVSPPGWHQLFILDGPTPSHSVWVRIGGDPGQLGNWPQLPGFTTPGV
ncbi:related to glyoxal oxidase precursor [Armillaria ostoyae]|uniref:Related to glyoxal oxidase n=1 Tax=Armillaria ostoyae TaxID=47428 RepID=A0A284RJE9_ARMOS|nr:related to glyoxal oxidase precursor [Armillaria ostoyae]